MAPWQVAVGLSFVILIPLGVFVGAELSYLGGYWEFVLARYGYHVANVALTVYFGSVFGVYQVVRSLSLGDVGSRLAVLDRTVREGRGGDPELSKALQREESGDYQS